MLLPLGAGFKGELLSVLSGHLVFPYGVKEAHLFTPVKDGVNTCLLSTLNLYHQDGGVTDEVS